MVSLPELANHLGNLVAANGTTTAYSLHHIYGKVNIWDTIVPL
jgi:hypothetical protein